jgi:uncharacterized protein YeaO (DUF488 family)
MVARRNGGFMIRVKRAYDAPQRSDGSRFLVDHLWPRGVKKQNLNLKSWVKAVAPSNQLRKWFGHAPGKWPEFQRRYFEELDAKPETWQPLLQTARQGDITLVYSARDTEHNNAVALKSYLAKHLKATAAGRQRKTRALASRAA